MRSDLGPLWGKLRRRYFSRYNRQAIGDTSAMRNKVAGTVASSWVQERTGQQADLGPLWGNALSLLQQVQPASNWRYLGNAQQNGRDRGIILGARKDWTTGGLGTSLGQMRRRDFSRYNRQAIGDTSAMLNKMAGTGSTMFGV
jgi:hypothetical protein